LDNQPFRILSLDGGGIMGAFSASAALPRSERVTGHRVVEHFDLIAGTSTGGIIAIGLAMGASADELCSFYTVEGPKIFPPVDRSKRQLRWGHHLIRRATGPPSSDGRFKALWESGCWARLGLVVIPAFDINTARFTSSRLRTIVTICTTLDLPAVDAALATSAAPTYFPAHTIAGRGTFVDGGLWANCPTIVGWWKPSISCISRSSTSKC